MKKAHFTRKHYLHASRTLNNSKVNTGDNNDKVINIHEPLLLFLSLWHCLGVHIYWDFSLERAMTGPQKTGQREGGRWGGVEGTKREEMAD